MAAADQTRLTLLDHAKILDPDGKVAQVIEILNQTNLMLQDAPAYTSNAPMGHRTVFRSSLPTVQFTKLNQGVGRSKSTTEQRQDAIGLIAASSEVDAKLSTIIGSGAFAQERKKQDDGFIESMSQFVQDQLLYGDTKANEASFDGFKVRMNSLNAGTSLVTSQVWDYAGSPSGGDLTSIYIVDWGERAAKLIFPPESSAGLKVADKGEIRVTDAESNPFFAYVTAYDWAVGLAVEDPRHVARLANIDLSNALAESTFVLADKLIDIMSTMPDPGGNQRVMYCHPRLFAAFHKQALKPSNAAFTMNDYLGRLTPHFWGYPLRRTDRISITESAVS
jgi:hypothetical protein